LQNLGDKNQVAPATLINGAMIATESVRRRYVRNNYSKKQIPSRDNIFAFGEEILHAALKNRNKTSHGRGHAINGREEGLENLQKYVTVGSQDIFQGSCKT
jgi:hypothetical protein